MSTTLYAYRTMEDDVLIFSRAPVRRSRAFDFYTAKGGRISWRWNFCNADFSRYTKIRLKPGEVVALQLSAGKPEKLETP